MSREGITMVADIFNHMQNARYELLKRGSQNPHLKECQQDLKLARLLDDMKETANKEFMKITIE